MKYYSIFHVVCSNVKKKLLNNLRKMNFNIKTNYSYLFVILKLILYNSPKEFKFTQIIYFSTILLLLINVPLIVNDSERISQCNILINKFKKINLHCLKLYNLYAHDSNIHTLWKYQVFRSIFVWITKERFIPKLWMLSIIFKLL